MVFILYSHTLSFNMKVSALALVAFGVVSTAYVVPKDVSESSSKAVKAREPVCLIVLTSL